MTIGCCSGRKVYTSYPVLGPLHGGVPTYLAYRGGSGFVRVYYCLSNCACPGRWNVLRRRLLHRSSFGIDAPVMRVQRQRYLGHLWLRRPELERYFNVLLGGEHGLEH